MRRRAEYENDTIGWTAFGWFIVALIVMFMLACSSQGGTQPNTSQWVQYRSVAWEYRYAEPGYSEHLVNMDGVLIFERKADSARVRSAEEVVGYFQGQLEDDPPTGYTGVVWKPDFVMLGVVTPGSPFTFISVNYALWPADGTYVARGDTIFYDASSADSTFILRIRYQR